MLIPRSTGPVVCRSTNIGLARWEVPPVSTICQCPMHASRQSPPYLWYDCTDPQYPVVSRDHHVVGRAQTKPKRRILEIVTTDKDWNLSRMGGGILYRGQVEGQKKVWRSSQGWPPINGASPRLTVHERIKLRERLGGDKDWLTPLGSAFTQILSTQLHPPPNQVSETHCKHRLKVWISQDSLYL